MTPTPGRVVLYTLSPSDLVAAATALPGAKLFTDENGKPDRVEWAGNPLRAGQVYAADVLSVWSSAFVNLSAADVLSVWSSAFVNLSVKLDGPSLLWLTSKNEGDAEGHWHWPSRA